ncbi:MAG TPA: hypothetical protein VK625_15280, partial [Flavitalea sp.]|nr:hypothetical protein [Flavitalea sp.]
LGLYYVVTDQKDKAVQMLENAEQMDPLSPLVVLSLGNMYAFAERFEDAIKQAEKMLAIYPQMRTALELKAWSTGMKGDWSEALTVFEEVYRLTNHPLKGIMGLSHAYGKLGFTDKVMDYIEKMEQRQREEPNSVVDMDLACAWFGLGNLDKTFYYFNQCVNKKVGPVSYFLEYPAFKKIKKDPRFEELKKKMGLRVF